MPKETLETISAGLANMQTIIAQLQAQTKIGKGTIDQTHSSSYCAMHIDDYLRDGFAYYYFAITCLPLDEKGLAPAEHALRRLSRVAFDYRSLLLQQFTACRKYGYSNVADFERNGPFAPIVEYVAQFINCRLDVIKPILALGGHMLIELKAVPKPR
ncbi:MAG TPA: hypothetical protein VJI32_07865 [Candidatus Nanoarchaeia archaeon]|nr:hypothetical protein [Candidatus Nanoarchaeia archaeon]